MKVIVLCGGDGVERVVSLASGDAVASWLALAGYEAYKLDPAQPEGICPANKPLSPPEIGAEPPTPLVVREFDPSRVTRFLNTLQDFKPDIAFPILHGDWGEDGTLQSLLDWVGLPYTGSGPLACALAMNKQKTKDVWNHLGILTPKSRVVSRRDETQENSVHNALADIGLPAVFKPLHGGSTVGLRFVRKENDVTQAIQTVMDLGDDLLIESYVDGREVTVVILDNEAMPLIEICPHEGFYDYHNKYTSGRSDYLCPAPLEKSLSTRIKEVALQAHRALDCRGFSRVDFLVTSHNEAYCLELNTLPGMTKTSLVPKAAKAAGIEPPELVDRIVKAAYAT